MYEWSDSQQMIRETVRRFIDPANRPLIGNWIRIQPSELDHTLQTFE